MMGVSDTACFLLGRSSRSGQTGGTKVYESLQLSSVYDPYTHTYTAWITRDKHIYTCTEIKRKNFPFHHLLYIYVAK